MGPHICWVGVYDSGHLRVGSTAVDCWLGTVPVGPVVLVLCCGVAGLVLLMFTIILLLSIMLA